MEYDLRHVLSVVDELVKLKREFFGWDVDSAFNVAAAGLVSDVYDEKVV